MDGPTLGVLLAETGVPVLVLNACRSAYNEPETPSTDDPADQAAELDNRRRRGGGWAGCA